MSETCRVLFQNKFEKLVHLVGFIIRIYHDARSAEREISNKRLLIISNFHNYIYKHNYMSVLSGV